jgi:hypothetical protein
VSTLIKSTRQIYDHFMLVICLFLAALAIWRAFEVDNLLAAWMCIALAICLILTGIALIDYRNNPATSDNGQ